LSVAFPVKKRKDKREKRKEEREGKNKRRKKWENFPSLEISGKKNKK
jgi:hypothetical protein